MFPMSCTRCGRCKQVGHNKRTCNGVLPVEDANEDISDHGSPPPHALLSDHGKSTEVPPADNEEEMQADYNEMLLDFPEEGPPITQPSQVENVEHMPETVEQMPQTDEQMPETVEQIPETDIPIVQEEEIMGESGEEATPLEVAARKIRQLRYAKLGLTTTLDSPIMVAAEKIKKLKESKQREKAKEKTIIEEPEKDNQVEDERMKAIKKEMKERIEKNKKRKGTPSGELQPLRRSWRLSRLCKLNKFENTKDTPVCIDDEADTMIAAMEGQSTEQKTQLNSYTGPMKLGKQMPPPVKQYKTIVGKTEVKSAPFLSHGKNVITRSALAKAIQETETNLKTKSKGKEKQA